MLAGGVSRKRAATGRNARAKLSQLPPLTLANPTRTPLASFMVAAPQVKMARMKIQPAARIRGQLSVPGDKSISHRAAIIAALAEGSSQLANYSTSQDCASTLSCLRSLGVAIRHEGSGVRVDGRGATGLSASPEPLDCGNSGSTMRMLAGFSRDRTLIQC